ncbi:MAG: hypothetical protein AAF821_15150 [Cyanobacteria bacterium P01_D01_bin.156]
MSSSAYEGFNEEGFFDRVEAHFVQKAPNLSQTLNIAVIGKVSTGKSSLIRVCC